MRLPTLHERLMRMRVVRLVLSLSLLACVGIWLLVSTYPKTCAILLAGVAHVLWWLL